MPRPQLTHEAISAFRERLAEVATRLFAERGYDAVTMRAVAQALGVSTMTPYRYVADKAELLVLVRTAAFRRFADAQRDAAGGATAARERISALGRAYLEFALREPDAYRIMFELRQPSVEDAKLEGEVARSFSYLLAAVEAAVAAGELSGDALSLAHFYWATTHGLVSLHLADKLVLGRDLGELSAELNRGSRDPTSTHGNVSGDRSCS